MSDASWSRGVTHALFTNRHGGISSGPYASLNLGLNTDDSPETVRTNRRLVVEQLPLHRTIVAATQVHGTGVITVPDQCDDPWEATATSQCTADVLVVRGEQHAVAVTVADCLPIALAGSDVSAAVHAGWRGLAAGIIGVAIDAMRDTGSDVHAAAIGPGLGVCCFEIGDEVAAQFPGHVTRNISTGRWHLDARRAAGDLLRDQNVTDIVQFDVCTRCGDGYYSHRRDSGVTGRQCAVVWQAPGTIGRIVE